MEQIQTDILSPTFGDGFLKDHAGRLMEKPSIAIVELVANSWDAGARSVRIKWPEESGGHFEILDDGTGMTEEEFKRIWPELNYNRTQHVGSQVIFPTNITDLGRTAYGRNGKGRHSLFCFSNTYTVETWKNGSCSTFTVSRSDGKAPFIIQHMQTLPKEGHGTRIHCTIEQNHLPKDDVIELLGSKFITDPDFSIWINEDQVDLFKFEDSYEETSIELSEDEGEVTIYRFDSHQTGRISRHHGVAWWVNRRLVGEHSWKGFEGSYLLDGRSSQAKRFTFIVKADILVNEVKPDWTGFRDNPRSKRIIEDINTFILSQIQEVMQDVRRDTKKKLITKHKQLIKDLSNSSIDHLGLFIDQIQQNCPTMTVRDLSHTIEILSKMELTRSGYGLLQKLVTLSPDDIDSLHSILDKWSINDAKRVLDELYWRLNLITDMERLVDDPETKELQELQPLFEHGLWIFGPEYESVEYTSNRTLKTVIEKLFHGGKVEHPDKRPDFVVLPDSTISTYSSDHYDERGEPDGINKVIIIELKKGGSIITVDERRQAEDYANEILNCGKIDSYTKMVCYVLGSTVECPKSKMGDNDEVLIYPRPYSTVLRQAHSRTFNLIGKIKTHKGIPETITDLEMKEILAQREIEDVHPPTSVEG